MLLQLLFQRFSSCRFADHELFSPHIMKCCLLESGRDQGRRAPVTIGATLGRVPRALVILVACSAAACSASTHPPASAPAAVPVRIPAELSATPAAVNLTGAWTTGSVREPTAAEIVFTPQCNYSPALWILEQSGDTVRAYTTSERWAKGVAEAETLSRVGVEGRVSGVEVTIGDSDSRYLLRYDSTSGHLRGTLRGAPFWAVRLKIVQPTGCIPVP